MKTINVKKSEQLNDLLSDVLTKLQNKEISNDTAKSIAMVADKINKNNTNAIIYKRVTNHSRKLDFFE